MLDQRVNVIPVDQVTHARNVGLGSDITVAPPPPLAARRVRGVIGYLRALIGLSY